MRSVPGHAETCERGGKNAPPGEAGLGTLLYWAIPPRGGSAASYHCRLPHQTTPSALDEVLIAAVPFPSQPPSKCVLSPTRSCMSSPCIGTISAALMLTCALKTTRSRLDDPLHLLHLLWGLPCNCRSYWASRGYGRMRRWLSQHARRSLRSRRVAGRFARPERVPSHIPAISPLRPISPMESAISDVRCAMNYPV